MRCEELRQRRDNALACERDGQIDADATTEGARGLEHRGEPVGLLEKPRHPCEELLTIRCRAHGARRSLEEVRAELRLERLHVKGDA